MGVASTHLSPCYQGGALRGQPLTGLLEEHPRKGELETEAPLALLIFAHPQSKEHHPNPPRQCRVPPIGVAGCLMRAPH